MVRWIGLRCVVTSFFAQEAPGTCSASCSTFRTVPSTISFIRLYYCSIPYRAHPSMIYVCNPLQVTPPQ